MSFYRDRGYLAVRVGQPVLQTLEDTEDGRTRWVALKIPVTEGLQYRVAEFTIEGNKEVPADYLLSLFKLRRGELYSEKEIREGLNKARELYGALGRFEFTAYPDLRPRDAATAADPGATTGPVVDVTLRVDEGPRYTINRIMFVGNTTTRDQVVRRELRVLRRGPLQQRSAEDEHQAAQPARLLQAHRRAEGHPGRQDAERNRQSGPDAEARRAEPQSAELRRRDVRLVRRLRQCVVRDDQFSRSRGNALGRRRIRHAQQQLSVVDHRAVHLRPADLDGREPLLAQDPVLLLFVGSGLQRSARGHVDHDGEAAARLHEALRRLHLGDGRQRIERRVPAIAGGIQRRGESRRPHRS